MSWVEIKSPGILSSLRTQTGPWSDTLSYDDGGGWWWWWWCNRCSAKEWEARKVINSCDSDRFILIKIVGWWAMSIMATWWHDDKTSWRWQWFLEMAMMMMMTIKHPFAERRRRREIRKSIVWVEVASGGRFYKNTICILLIINTMIIFVKTSSSPKIYKTVRTENYFLQNKFWTDLFVCVTWDCCGCIGDKK